MQSKKFLSTLLVLVLIVTCALGMLMTNAGAREEKISVEFNTDLATTIAGINGEDFTATQYAEIVISGEQTATVDENGVLFGVPTIFDSTGARLPITITVAEDDTAALVLDEGVKGNISCSNSYTFKNIGFYLADAAEQVNFFAGSGEVVLDNVTLSADNTGKSAYLYADNASSAAYAGWTEANVAAAKGEGNLIPASLTLKNTDYAQCEGSTGGSTAANTKGQVGAIGAKADFASQGATVTASMTGATLIIEDSEIGGVWLRNTEAVSPVAELNFIVNDTSESGVDGTTLTYLTGVGVGSINSAGENKGNEDLPAFNYNVTINGGTIVNRVMFFRGMVFDGNLNVTVNGGKFNSEVFTAYGSGVGGTSTATVNGGNFLGTLYGPNASGDDTAEDVIATDVSQIENFMNINGGTIAAYQGNRVTGSIVTNVSGGTITTYYGSYVTDSGGGEYDMIVNNINGGTITNYFGSGRASTNKPSGYNILKVVNNFNGGTIKATAFGAGLHKSVKEVVNNYNGTKFEGNVHGTYGATVTSGGKTSYVGTNVTGTVTNNYNPNQNGAANSGKFAKDPYQLGGSIAGDLIVNIGSEGQTPSNSNSKDKGITKMVGSSLGSKCTVGGDVTFNIWCAYTFEGAMEFWEGPPVSGDFNFNIWRMTSHTSNWYPVKAWVDGDVNIRFENCSFNRTDSSDPRTIKLIDRAAGKKMNVYLKNVTIGVGEKFELGALQNELLLSFEDVTMNYDYKGITSNVIGTFTQEWKGNNTFKNGYVTIAEGKTVGTLVNVLAPDNMTTNFVGNTTTVPKVINYVTGGTISGNFYGTGAPVGTFVPAAEEGGEATFVPGDVENYLTGGTISGIFFGTGADTVANVTNTVNGGKVSSNSASGASQLTTNACYYGNLGNVTGKVTNQIWSGSIGNNYSGSHGIIDGAVINLFGNKLYAELYPEAEALSKPTVGRTTLVGAKYVGTDYAGNTYAGVFGTAKYVVAKADNATLGQFYGIGASTTGVNAETGCAVEIDFKNVTATSNNYIFGNNPDIPQGDIYVSFEGCDLNNGSTPTALRTFTGTKGVTPGTTTYRFVNCTIGHIDTLGSDKSGNGDFNLIMIDSELQGKFSDFSKTDSGYTRKGTAKYYFENSILNSFSGVTYMDGTKEKTNASYTIQFFNRPASKNTLEFNGCTFLGNAYTFGMQGKTNDQYYVYGDTVIGGGVEDTLIYGSRQSKTVCHIGAKPDANGNPVPVETNVYVAEGSKFYATREYASTAYIYDVSLTGTGLVAPCPDADTDTDGWQYNTSTANSFVLKGNLSMGEVSPEVYLNASDVNGGTVSALGGKWVEGKVYVTALGNADIAKITGRTVGAGDGYAKRVNNTLVGAKFAGCNAVSLDVEERIVLKLWILKDDVDAYVNSGMLNTVGENAFEYWASIALEDGEYYLCEGQITPENLADIEISEDGLYYKLTAGAVSANNFDKEIEFATSAFAINQVAEDTPITVLNIAETGIEDPNNAANAKALNLFKAIYNYGAAVCDGFEMIEMTDFVQDVAAAPVYQKGSDEDIAFTSMSLLMGDAIGIRFNGDVIDYDARVTMKVNGEPADHYNYDFETGTVDVYVNLANVNEVFTFIIYTDGAPAIAVKTSIKGYTEAVMVAGAAELAVAQLAQACADILA